MLDLIAKLPLYCISRRLNWPKILPFNLAICLTNRCNFRCKTCCIYEKSAEELSFEELEKIFKSMRKCLYWVTLTGGEPFLRDDIDKIFLSLCAHCRPRIVNIATNGFFTEIIIDKIKKMANVSNKVKLIINFSIDDIDEYHDKIRGKEGSYKKVVETFYALKSLNLPNLLLGINTTISKFNAERIPVILEEILKLGADSYIAEVADKRIELNTMDLELLPSDGTVFKALDFFNDRITLRKTRSIPKIIQTMRGQYYTLSKNTLLGKTTISCYAGIASIHISADGHLWTCPVKAKVLGNLKETDYDFKKIWFSKRADKIKQEIKKENCFCLSANVNYTNLLCNFKSLIKIGLNLI